MGAREPRKIALFSSDLAGGGAERVMVNLARGLSDKGFPVDMVLTRARGPFLSEVPQVVRIVDLNARGTILSLPQLARYLREVQPKVLMSTKRHANLVAICARALSRTPVRIVVREANMLSVPSQNHSFRSSFVNYLMRKLYPRADEIVANSSGMAEDIAHTLGLSLERVQVIHNPTVTPDLLERAKEPLDHPWFAPGEPPVILGVGRLIEQKDFSTLIRAFSRVRRGRVARLVILGEDRGKRAELNKLRAELGLEDSVAFPGFVANPFAYMSRATVFVLSSRWEGLPNALIQAMACGCPVVSTNCPSGPAEILKNGKYGLLVPMQDEIKLAEAIQNTMDTPLISTELLKARAQDFSLERITDAYLSVLLDIKPSQPVTQL